MDWRVIYFPAGVMYGLDHPAAGWICLVLQLSLLGWPFAVILAWIIYMNEGSPPPPPP